MTVLVASACLCSYLPPPLSLLLDLPTPPPSPTHPPTTHHTPSSNPTPQESIQSNFGDFGAAALLGSLQIRYYDEATHIFILRCPREGYRSAWAAMTLVTSLGGSSSSSSGTKASISVLRVSGSVRTCRTDAVEILVAAAAAAAGIGQMEQDEREEEEATEAKRAYYQAHIEGAIQGV